MKKLILLLSVVSTIFANELVVKKADVKISINGEVKSLTKGEKIALEAASSICFIDGKGKVIINKRKQLTKKSKKCYNTPLPKGFKIADFMEKVSQKAKVALITGEIKVKNGVSTKGNTCGMTYSGTQELDKNQKEIIIFNMTYGPLPVILGIYDENRELVAQYVNDDSIETFFRIPTEILDYNYRFVITNAFGEELLNNQLTKATNVELVSQCGN